MTNARDAHQQTSAAQPGVQPWFSLARAWSAWTEDLLLHNRFPLSGDVTQWIRTWGEAVSQIGFFNVNVAGSADPRLEKTIGTRYSYGRQLGRMLDMLAPLVKASEGSLRKSAGDKSVEEFQEMVTDIARLKRRSVEDVVHDVRRWQTSPTFEQDLAELLQRLTKLVPRSDTDAATTAAVHAKGRRLSSQA